MLELTATKIKSIIEKTKMLFAPTLAGLTLLGVVGCQGTSLGRKWKTIDSYTKTVEKGEFETSKVKYFIEKAEISKDMTLSAYITESRTKEKYKEREIVNFEKLEEYETVKGKGREVEIFAGGGIGFIVGFLPIYIIQINEKTTGLGGGERINSNGEAAASGCIFGLLLGSIGAAVGAETAKDKKTTVPTGETREIRVGSSVVKEQIGTERTPEAPSETYVLFKSRNVKFTKVDKRERTPQKELSVYSKHGEAKVKIREDIPEFAFKKEDLVDQIKK